MAIVRDLSGNDLSGDGDHEQLKAAHRTDHTNTNDEYNFNMLKLFRITSAFFSVVVCALSPRRIG